MLLHTARSRLPFRFPLAKLLFIVIQPVPKIIFLIISILLFITACDNSSRDNSRVSLKVPQNLIAHSGARSVELLWNGVTNASGYTVYWSNNPNVTRSTGAAIHTTEPHYLHKELNNGSYYYYAVTSHTGGVENALSKEVRGQPQLAAPELPMNFRLKAEDRRVTIDFGNTVGTTDYQILWATNPNVTNNPNYINHVIAPLVHTDLINGQTYYYLLRVSNSAGKSTDSDVFQVTPKMALPVAPVFTAVTTRAGEVTLSWDNTSNAEAYDLYWSNLPNVSTDNACVLQVNSPYTHAPISSESGQHYYYRLQARNQTGVSPLSNEAHVITTDTATLAAAGDPPASPPIDDGSGNELIKVGIGDGQLKLDWQAASGPASLGYNLYWVRGTTALDPAIALEKDTHVLDTDVNNTGVIRNIQPPYTHIGLQNDVYYYYRISAINDSGESALTPRPAPPLTLPSARPERVRPGVPAGVTVWAGDQSITVYWTPVDRAESYQLSIANVGLNTSDSATTISSPYTFNNLNNGQEYSIQIESVTSGQNSDPSSAIIATPQAPAPNAPTGLVAIPGNGFIQLQWHSAIPQQAVDPTQALVESYLIYTANHPNVSPANGTLLDSLSPQVGNVTGTWQVNVPALKNGQRYYFSVTAVNVTGGESQPSATAWALPQIPVPSIPSNLYAETGNNEVTLHFDPVTEVSGSPSYNLYWSKDTASGRSVTEVITNISQSPAYRFTDGNSNGTTYYFRVSAINAGGEGKLSSEVSVTPQIPAPQVVPGNLTAVATNAKVALTWDAVTDANTNQLDYVIYWSTDINIDPAVSAALIVSNGQVTFEHTSLNNGQHYYYRMAVRSAGGEGPLSDLVSAIPQVDPPATPSGFGLVAGDAQVTINWASVANANLVNPVSQYVLYWRRLNDPDWSLIQGVQSGYVHADLSNSNQVYEYQLVAQNPGGNSAPTAIKQATPQQSPPVKPQGLAIAAGDQRNSLNWFTQTGVSYTLHWSTGNADPLTSGQVFNNVSPVSVHGSMTPLTNGQTYNYQLVASTLNGGDSVPSEIVSAVPEAPVIGAPTGLSAQAGDQRVTLNWFAPADALVGTTYTLYWGTQAGSAPTTAIANVQAPYVHTNLENDKVYYYFVKATNTAGIVSPASINAQAKPVAALPSTPLGVSVASGNASNALSWSSATAASSYTIEWSIVGDFSDVFTTSVLAPVSQFIHTGLTNGQTVFYRVLALNSNAERSGYSNIVSGTPQVTSEPVNSPPLATNLSISDDNGGNLIAGTRLTGHYDFSDVDGDNEGATRFQWYRAGSAINGETTLSHVLTIADIGQTIAFEVTPLSLTGTSPGSAVSVLISTSSGSPLISNTDVSPTIQENSNVVTTITVVDSDSSSFTYALSGLDSALFTTVGDSLQFISAPDYEAPKDSGEDNVYNVTVVASDGINNSLAKNFSITVTDVFDTVLSKTNLVGISSGLLVDVDTLTGNVTAKSGIGLAGFTAIKQLSYDHINKRMYALNELPNIDTSTTLGFTQIVSFDPVKGSKRVEGFTGLVYMNSVGIAVDPTAQVVYSLNANGDFYFYDLVNKTTSSVTNIGVSDVKGLTIDLLGGGDLYTIQTSTNQLISITAAGAASIVNTLTTDMIVPEVALNTPYSLSFDPNTDKIIAVVPVTSTLASSGNNELMSINKSTAVATSLGTFHLRDGYTDISVAFAYDPLELTNNTLYFTPRISNGMTTILSKINLPTYGGQNVTRIPIPFNNLRAVAFDRTTSTLYGVDEISKSVLVYNVASSPPLSIAAQVNVPGNVLALAINSSLPNVLYATNGTELYSIDKTSWGVTLVGALGTNIKDMAFDPATNILWAIDGVSNISGNGLVTINTATGAASAPLAITGTALNRLLMGIGFSGAGPTYQLHGIATDNHIYSVDIISGVATDVDATKAVTPNAYTSMTFNGNNLIRPLYASLTSIDITNLTGFSYAEVELVEHTYPTSALSLALDSNTNTFYVYNFSNLYTVDPNTGLATKLGRTTASRISAITFDPTTNELYGIEGLGNDYTLYTIKTVADLLNPLDTLVGTISNVPYLSDIAIDGAGLMYGVYGSSTPESDSDLILIDRSTNPFTVTKQRLPYSNGGSIAYDALSDEFIITSTKIPDNLARVSKTGAVTRIGELSVGDIAYQPSSDTIYTLYTVPQDASVGINTSISAFTITPVMSLGRFENRATAHDNTSNTLYMIDNSTNNLLKVDKATGEPTVIGFTEFNSLSALVYDPLAAPGEQLLGYDSTASQFVFLNTSTGRGLAYPAPAISRIVTDLAIDTSANGGNTLYALTGNGMSIATLDRVTKTLGPDINIVDQQGVAFGIVYGITIDASGSLYGVDSFTGCGSCIVNIDKTTGTATYTGKGTGFNIRTDLSFDKNANIIYVTDLGTGHLISVDPITVAGTTHGGFYSRLRQLVYSPSNATTYGLIPSLNRELYSVDANNGDTTFVDGAYLNGITASISFAVNSTSTTFYSSYPNSPNSDLTIFDITSSINVIPFNLTGNPQTSLIDLEWNPTTNTLFGLSTFPTRLFQISDLATASGAFISPTEIGTSSYNSLAYSPQNKAFFTIDSKTTLLVIDELTGNVISSIPLIGDLPALSTISYQP